MSKGHALSMCLLLGLLLGAGVVIADMYVEATPVALSWLQYAIHEGESRPHAYIQYRLVTTVGSTPTVCAEREVDTGLDAFDAPGTDEIPVSVPPPWELESVPCHGEVEEQTRLVWRTSGEPPLYGVPLPAQQDRGEGWVAHRTINLPGTSTAVEIMSIDLHRLRAVLGYCLLIGKGVKVP
jgi:hypothetical protein